MAAAFSHTVASQVAKDLAAVRKRSLTPLIIVLELQPGGTSGTELFGKFPKLRRLLDGKFRNF